MFEIEQYVANKLVFPINLVCRSTVVHRWDRMGDAKRGGGGIVKEGSFGIGRKHSIRIIGFVGYNRTNLN